MFCSRKVESSGQSWPTVSREVSGFYGIRENGTYSDHVNIAGTADDEIYAVADGVVLETAFENSFGYFIVVDLGDGNAVRYGHLNFYVTFYVLSACLKYKR